LLCEHCITCKLKDRGLSHPLSSAHTYRCLFVKELARFALLVASLFCQQRRNEILKIFLRFSNYFREISFFDRRCQPK
jgi:hypothetical protein